MQNQIKMAQTEDGVGTTSNNKLSHKQWKKLKRKLKRQAAAQEISGNEQLSKGTDEEEEEERRRQAVEEENARQNAEWERRDRLAHQVWLEAKEQEEKERLKREETERKIREEWEEREHKERKEEEKREKDLAEKRDKQDSLLKKATENEHKEWHNPLAPPTYSNHSNAEIIREVNKCPFFTKTGACRFGDRCSRAHLRPDSSTIILIAGMFDSFELKQSSIDDYDTDMNLEYEDTELYRSFREFYLDVVPEFKTVGRVVNVKVCCNHEPHLRGNVYMQYKRESEAHDAFVKFNARWYGGRQLTCEFVTISKWKSAICGLFFAKRCPKGKACNFLHVFRNPGNEFWEADRDFENSARHYRRDDTPRWAPRSERHDRRWRRSRSRSKTHESSKFRSDRYRTSRDRSRSPKLKSQSGRGVKERSQSYQRIPRHRDHSISTNSSSRNRQRRSRSRSTSPSRGRSRSRDRSQFKERSRGRAWSRERSRGKSWSSSRSRSRERHSVTRTEQDRSTSKTPEHSENGEVKKQKSKSKRNRSWSRSPDCLDSGVKKFKKSKDKKAKKSGKKKKKHKSKKSPSNLCNKDAVSLDHLDDGGVDGDDGEIDERGDNAFILSPRKDSNCSEQVEDYVVDCEK